MGAEEGRMEETDGVIGGDRVKEEGGGAGGGFSERGRKRK